MMNLPEIRQPFKETFPGDNTYNNYPRQTPGVLYALVEPMEFPKPELILFNEELGEELMISKDNIGLFSGQSFQKELQHMLQLMPDTSLVTGLVS
jgi:hypothetical protein